MSARKRTPPQSKASDLVLIKVRLPKALVERIDAVCGPGERAELIRDVLADRLPPSPVFAAAKRMKRVLDELERAWSSLKLLAGMQAFAGDRTLLADLARLENSLREAIAASNELRAAVVDDMLARIDLKRKPR